VNWMLQVFDAPNQIEQALHVATHLVEEWLHRDVESDLSRTTTLPGGKRSALTRSMIYGGIRRPFIQCYTRTPTRPGLSWEQGF
jgi:hypothetical protein